jgi:DNA-binding transcriptional LysR family regulator
MPAMHQRMALRYARTMDWDDLRFFLVLARHRTLSAAARDLAVTQPTVGRRIAALEKRLGAKLFVRRSDGFVLSGAGAHVLTFAEQMERNALAAELRVSGQDEGVRGTVRVTASEWLVSRVLPPLLAPLIARHPELEIELGADQRHLNLARREADIALRPRRFEHDTIVQRATAKLGFGLYAARSYLSERGAPTPENSQGHILIGMTSGAGDVARAWLEALLPRAKRTVRTNGRDAMLALAVEGVGLACLARFVGDQVPSLERIETTSPPASPSPTLWIGMHRDARDTPRVRAVASHLAAQLRALQPQLCPAD